MSWTPPPREFLAGWEGGWDAAVSYLTSNWPEFADQGEDFSVEDDFAESKQRMMRLWREGPPLPKGS